MEKFKLKNLKELNTWYTDICWGLLGKDEAYKRDVLIAAYKQYKEMLAEMLDEEIKMAEKNKELKLEVGKKYKSYEKDKPSIFLIVDDLRKHGIKTHRPMVGYCAEGDSVYTFSEKGGCCDEIPMCECCLKEEHRETYKNVSELWIETEGDKENDPTMAAMLTGLRGIISVSENHYINTHGGILKKYRITTEVITEDSADD